MNLTISAKKIVLTLIFLVVCTTFFSPAISKVTEAQFEAEIGAATAGSIDAPEEIQTEESRTGIVSTGQQAGLSGWRLTVYNLLTTIGAMFAWIGGFLLDVSISVFVANMAGAASYMGLTSVVVALWEVIRDAVNLLFIFSLIWIGFQTILGTGGANTKKWVANLVIAALLINFSLYITQVVIDFSNVTAFQISKMMQTEARPDKILGIEVNKISSGFVAKTNLQNFPKTSQESLTNLMGPNSGFDGFVAALAMGFVVMLMLIIMGFVFAAGAVILFTRFIVLTFLMVFSPLLFMSWIFPALGGYGSRVSKMLISQAIVGPIFIFMLYFSYRALEGFSRLGADGKEYTITNILVYFIVVIGFVCLSLVAAKSFGAYGAGQAVSMGKSVGKWARLRAGNAAGSAVFGSSAALMRSTIGNRAQRAAESGQLLDRAKNGGIGGWAARRQLSALKTVGDSSLDVRKIGGVGKSLGIGEGAKGGYKTMRSNYAKAQKDFADSLGEVGDDDLKVKEYSDKAKDLENKLKDAKDEYEAIPKANTAARKAFRENTLEPTERALKEAKVTVQREKSRRQVGSVEYNAIKTETEKALKAEEAVYKKHQEAISNSKTYEEQAAHKKAWRASVKKIAKYKKDLKDAGKSEGGYAAKLSNTSTLTSLFSGQLPSFNKKAGKEIEEKYSKKFKQNDDDKRFGAVVDAVKDGAKK